jgi:hypothetical protein
MEEDDFILEEITDPAELASLNATEFGEGYEEITDPKELAILNGDPVAEEGWYEDPMMATRAVLDGLWYGWSDEVGAGIAAGAAKATGEERPYGEIYDEMVMGLQEERNAYADTHPVANVALGMTGALLSPANKLGSTYLGKKGGKSVKSIQEALEITRAGGPKVAKLDRLRRGLVVGVAEGTVAGAGVAESGEKASGAALGGALGTAFPLVGQGFRFAGGEIAKRRVAQELGKGDDFIPLNIADSALSGGDKQEVGGVIGEAYQNIVGKAFGGAGLIAQQTKRWTRPVVEAVHRTEEHLNKVTRNAKESLANMKESLTARTAERVSEASADSKLGVSVVRETKDLNSLTLKDAKINIMPAKVAALDAEVNAMESTFRSVAHESSLPRAANLEERNAVATMSPQKAMEYIDNLWSDKGFAVTKGQKFRVNPTKLLKDIDDIFEEDVLASSIAMSGGKTNEIRGFIEQYMTKFVQRDGTMSGEHLTQMRSQLGLVAGSLSDAGGSSAALKGVVTAMQRQIDDVIEAQLTPKQAVEFAAERKGWSHVKVLRDATTAAGRKAGQRGEFSLDDWQSAVTSNSPRGARHGEGPLQGRADQLAEVVAGRDQALTEAANQASRANVRAQQMNLSTTIKKLSDESVRLKRQLAEIRRTGKASHAKQRRVLAKESEIADIQMQLTGADGRGGLRAKRDSLQGASPRERSSMFEKLFANFLLGGGNVVTGGGVARGLGAQGTQRAIAGQTAVQKGLQSSLQASELAARNTSRAAARTGEMEAVSQ